MHEYSLVKDEIARIVNKIEGKKVNKINFSLGLLAHGSPSSIREAFKIATVNTNLSGTELEITKIEPKLKCSACESIFDMNSMVNFSCPDCGSKSNELISGKECYIESIEVEE